MIKKFFLLMSIATLAYANQPFSSPQENQIVVHNTILAKVDETTISVLDVKKKMDMVFYKNFPHLADSTQARYQFYDSSWKRVLSEMIDNQLILQEADQKKVTISDGEIREEIESRFGPNVMVTLDKIGLSFEDASKMIKEEMIAQRMMWWFVHSKAISQVTPQDIRQAYRAYLKENPAYDEYTYQVISIKGENAEQTSSEIHEFLKTNLSCFETAITQLTEKYPSIQISTQYTATSQQLSDTHKSALETLSPGNISSPLMQKAKYDKQSVARIFILKEKKHVPAPEFENLANDLKNKLTEKAVVLESTSYIDKLRKTYSYYENSEKDLKPFSLQ